MEIRYFTSFNPSDWSKRLFQLLLHAYMIGYRGQLLRLLNKNYRTLLADLDLGNTALLTLKSC